MAKRIIPELVRHYAEEASFQWIVRERALRSPDNAEEDLAALDARLEAQLDALRLAGDGGWDICREELKWEEPGEVFTAALMAFQSGDPERMQAVAEAAAAKPGLARALISALGWMRWEEAGPLIGRLAASETPVLRYAAVGGAAVQRRWDSKRMAAALKDKDPLVLARALKACGELGHTATLVAVEPHRDSPDEACRFWSQWSALLLGKKEAASGLLALGTQAGSVPEPGPVPGPARGAHGEGFGVVGRLGRGRYAPAHRGPGMGRRGGTRALASGTIEDSGLGAARRRGLDLDHGCGIQDRQAGHVPAARVGRGIGSGRARRIPRTWIGLGRIRMPPRNGGPLRGRSSIRPRLISWAGPKAPPLSRLPGRKESNAIAWVRLWS